VLADTTQDYWIQNSTYWRLY